MPEATPLRKFVDVRDHIDQLQVWADDQKKKKILSEFKSCFNTLNNRARYKFFWDTETMTHEKFLLFFILLKKVAKEHGMKKHVSDDDLESLLTNVLPMNRGAISMYMIAKLFNVKRGEMLDMDLPFDHIDPERYRKYIEQMDDYDLRNAEWNFKETEKLKKKIGKHKKTHKKKGVKSLDKYHIFSAWEDDDY